MNKNRNKVMKYIKRAGGRRIHVTLNGELLEVVRSSIFSVQDYSRWKNRGRGDI